MITGEEEDSANMITNHVTTVLKFALTTFRSKPEAFESNLEKLIELFNKTRSNHVNLHPMFMKESTWEVPSKAPMTYIGIFKNDILNMGIFILKHDMKLPLHNHPNMYGLLKVIAGTVKIKSFSIKSERSVGTDDNERLFIVANQNEDVIANSESGCCRLDPLRGNIHEIETIGGPAAFIDILSPPYDTYNPDMSARRCSYFRVTKENKPNEFDLEEISIPSWFWSDSFTYLGPEPKVLEDDQIGHEN